MQKLIVVNPPFIKVNNAKLVEAETVEHPEYREYELVKLNWHQKKTSFYE